MPARPSVSIASSNFKATSVSTKESAAASAKADLAEQEKLLIEVSSLVGRLRAAILHLKESHAQLEEKPDSVAQALHCRDNVLPAMVELRTQADKLEMLVDDALWPLPKYHELLFVH